MAEFQIKIFTTTFFAVNYQRQNEKYIMKKICKLQLPKQNNIQLNACRIYFKVTTLSDIVNPDRWSLNVHFIEGNRPISPCSMFKWPKQTHPSLTAWKLWRNKIQQIFNISEKDFLPLHNQLNKLIVPYPFRKIRHRWYHSKDNNEIYISHI